MDADQWVPAGLDLGFINESRPHTLRALLEKKDPRWRSLFARWLQAKQEAGYSNPLNPGLPDLYARTLTTLTETRDVKMAWRVGQRIPQAQWAAALGAFAVDCQTLRDQLRSHEKAARASLPKKASKTEVEREKNRLFGQSVMRARIDRRGLEEADGLVQLEASIVQRTLEIKPAFAELFRRFNEAKVWADRAQATDPLFAAYKQVRSAEAKLRYVCSAYRSGKQKLALAERQVSQTNIRAEAMRAADNAAAAYEAAAAAAQDLPEAWVGFLNAYRDLGEAMYRASKLCIRWAEKDTAKKIEDNFATVFPVMSGIMIAMNVAVTSLGAVVSLLGVGVGAATANPVVTAVSEAAVAALLTTFDAIRALANSAVSKAYGKNRAVVREHIGQRYVAAPKQLLGPASKQAVDKANQLTTKVTPAATAGLKAAAAISSGAKGSVLKAVPVIGMLPRAAGIAVEFHDLFNSKILESDSKTDSKGESERDKLLAMVNNAYATMDAGTRRAVQSQKTIRVLRLLDDGAVIEVGDIRGTIKNGRFTPSDRSGAFKAAVQAWRRARQAAPDAIASLSVPRGLRLLGRGGPGILEIRIPSGGQWEPAPYSQLEDPSVLIGNSVQEVPGSDYAPGGFEFEIYASSDFFGELKDKGSDVWRLKALLSVDGRVLIREGEVHLVELWVVAETDEVLWTADEGRAEEIVGDPDRACRLLMDLVMRHRIPVYERFELSAGNVLLVNGQALRDDRGDEIFFLEPSDFLAADAAWLDLPGQSGADQPTPFPILPPGATEIFRDRESNVLVWTSLSWVVDRIPNKATFQQAFITRGCSEKWLDPAIGGSFEIMAGYLVMQGDQVIYTNGDVVSFAGELEQ